jgi:sRNA-binding carbon storage regulator CsrA
MATVPNSTNGFYRDTSEARGSLTVTRQANERIRLHLEDGRHILIVGRRLDRHGNVRLTIDAPRSVRICRAERDPTVTVPQLDRVRWHLQQAAKTLAHYAQCHPGRCEREACACAESVWDAILDLAECPEPITEEASHA